MNEQAREEFWKLAEQARTRGRDLAEVLDRAGVLLTVEREAKIQADTLSEIATMLLETPPRSLSTSTNVLDFQRDLGHRIQAIADQRRK